MAAEGHRGFHPLVVVVDRAGPLLLVGRAEVALAIAHDEQALDAGVVRPLRELAELGAVRRLVLEELVHVLDGPDAEAARRRGEVERVELGLGAALQVAVQRPLRQRDLKQRLGGWVLPDA